ncbi:putative amidase [Thermoascus aurantiacus ATCC 26904]
MSVLFTSVSASNPVTVEDVRRIFGQIGFTPAAEDEDDDYVRLLVALHDCAETVASLPDYVFGNAWVHTFSIQDDSIKGPLTGKTVCLKDCIAVAQLLGTHTFEPWTPDFDATVVTRVPEAGAEIVGTTNCENLCQSTCSFSSAYGTVENPHAAGYSAGGSISGAAALVAGGVVDIAIGADQGGSIRVPAALGYDGIDDRAIGAPKPGTMTFAADLQASESDGLSGFKIGILAEAFDQPALDPALKEFVQEAAWKYKELGATVDVVSVPDHNIGTAAWTIEQRFSGCLTLLGKAHGRRGLGLTKLESAKLPWTQEKFEKCFPTTKNVFLNGLYLMEKFPGLYPKSLNLSRRLRDSYERVLETYDVLILPTTSFVAPKHGKITTPLETIKPTVGLTANTAMFDATGQPAMTIPVGFLPAKEDPNVFLPVGMQIVSGLWKDNKVLRAGHAWEKAFDWKQRKPELKPVNR